MTTEEGRFNAACSKILANARAGLVRRIALTSNLTLNTDDHVCWPYINKDHRRCRRPHAEDNPAYLCHCPCGASKS